MPNPDGRIKSQEAFENLLEHIKSTVKTDLNHHADPTTISGKEFESMVFDAIVKCAEGTSFEGKLVHTNDRDFPDIIVAGHFGIEVKATKKDDWASLGNSVLESSRTLSVEKIYVFFGKLGGEPDITYKNYENCLKGIAVTHYPRYQIDMNISPADSIFTKMDVSYEELRKSDNPIKAIRQYYKTMLKPGQSLWWLDDESDNVASVSPIMKTYASLEPEDKRKILAEVMILFPEVFSVPRAKYKKVAHYLASQYGVVSTSLRDEFSAGGKAIVGYKNKEYYFPHVVGEMLEASALISQLIMSQNKSLESWLKEIDRYSNRSKVGVRLSGVYTDGQLLAYKKNG